MAAPMPGWPAGSSSGPPAVARLAAELQQLQKLLERERGERAAGLAALEERLARLERGGQQAQPKKGEPSVDTGFELESGESDSDDETEADEHQACLCFSHRAKASKEGKNYKELGQLDDTIAFDESVWDAGVLLGTEYLSTSQSITIGFLMMLNFVIQSAFCWVVWSYMCDDSLSEEFLYSLLHFRTGIAHSVKYADLMSGRSLAAQVCGGDQKLVWAGSQVGLIDNIGSTKDGGVYLCILVVLCWLLNATLEVDKAMRFGVALHNLTKKGGETVIVNDGAVEDGGEGQLRLESISSPRFGLLLAVLVIPRMILSLVVTFVGIPFLVVTTDMGDLILNSLALAFITDIDDLLFAAFAGRRLKTVIGEMQPMTLPPTRKSSIIRFFSDPLGKMCIVFGILALVYVERISPFYWRMNQAFDILCSGNTDFVFAHNAATGLIHVAPSIPDGPSEMSFREQIILQMAHPKLSSGPGFYASPELVQRSQSMYREAVVEMSMHDVAVQLKRFLGNATVNASTRQGKQHVRLQDLTPNINVLNGLMHTQSSTVKEVSGEKPCADMTSAANVKRIRSQIRRVTGKYSDCKAAVEMCSWMNMTELRALCPVSCGCRFLLNPPASFFASSAWGCPSSCGNEFWLANAGAKPGQDVLATCADSTPAKFTTDSTLRVYVNNAMEFWRSKQQLLVGTYSMLSTDSERFGIPRADKRAAFVYFADGAFEDDVTNGRWNVAPGVPHPRQLTGCSFWTSWEMTLLLGFDVCAEGHYRSLRPYCPVACGCRVGGRECPPSCTAALNG